MAKLRYDGILYDRSHAKVIAGEDVGGEVLHVQGDRGKEDTKE